MASAAAAAVLAAAAARDRRGGNGRRIRRAPQQAVCGRWPRDERRLLDAATYITVDTELLTAKATDACSRRSAVGRRVEEVRRPTDEPGIEAHDRAPEARRCRHRHRTIRRSEPNLRRARRHGVEVQHGEILPERAGFVPRFRRQLKEVLADEPQLRRAARRLARLARRGRAAARRLLQLVDLANEGARELGYKDLGAMWRSGYDMPADDFTKEAARLWEQVQPFYEELHCYARGGSRRSTARTRSRLASRSRRTCSATCGRSSGTTIYDLLEPYPGASNLDVDAALKSSRDTTRFDDEVRRGLLQVDRLPGAAADVLGTFDAHAAARPRQWSAMPAPGTWTATRTCASRCASSPTRKSLRTIYHEMGHVYYYLWYKNQPFMFQDGAHDGFHEAIGDTINLSMTPRLPRRRSVYAGFAGRARRP